MSGVMAVVRVVVRRTTSRIGQRTIAYCDLRCRVDRWAEFNTFGGELKDNTEKVGGEDGVHEQFAIKVIHKECLGWDEIIFTVDA